MCPVCQNTLAVVPSDPSETSQTASASVLGEPPYFLYCSFCRWDSTEADITFEKPTGLAGTCSFVECLANNTVSSSASEAGGHCA
jgi:dynactin 4